MLSDPDAFYQYEYLDESGTPYYVGKGRHGRAFSPHDRTSVPPWSRIVVNECRSEIEALKKEASRIRELGLASLDNQGWGNTPEQNARIAAGNAANHRYRFIAADGSIYEPESVMAFVKEKGLNYSAVRQVAIGNRRQHMGWRVERVSQAGRTQ